jgi:hypothetical protein
MAPRTPGWINREPIKAADAEFNEALQADPFVGSVAVDALARFVKATEETRATTGRHIKTETITSEVLKRVRAARAAAEAAPDPVYTQIFSAQEQGWEAAQRIAQESAIVPEAPVNTNAKSMSAGKSNNT